MYVAAVVGDESNIFQAPTTAIRALLSHPSHLSIRAEVHAVVALRVEGPVHTSWFISVWLFRLPFRHHLERCDTGFICLAQEKHRWLQVLGQKTVDGFQEHLTYVFAASWAGRTSQSGRHALLASHVSPASISNFQ